MSSRDSSLSCALDAITVNAYLGFGIRLNACCLLRRTRTLCIQASRTRGYEPNIEYALRSTPPRHEHDCASPACWGSVE